MSLVSSTGLVGGIKEYVYRGIQQLPILLAATSLVFTVTTGSVAHANLALGMGVLMPAYTYVLQQVISLLLDHVTFLQSYKASFTRSTGDTCNLFPESKEKGLSFYTGSESTKVIPSYWLLSMAFFVGYGISNGIDCLMTPARTDSDPTHVEKRNSHAVFIIVALSIASVLLILMRVIYMRGCEGRGTFGLVVSSVAAVSAMSLGFSMYTLSRVCGSRSSDLFGVLSQLLPASATGPHPIVCAPEST